MTITQHPWTSAAATDTIGYRLELIPLPLLAALRDGNLQRARDLSDQSLSAFLVGESCRGVWRRRYTRILENEEDAIWVTRLLRDNRTQVVLGRAGFHGRPDLNGMVEIGYEIDPAHRRSGHGRAAVRIFLDVARDDARVKVVRASIGPDNMVSRKIIDEHRFQKVGEQIDEEDGLEEIFELAC